MLVVAAITILGSGRVAPTIVALLALTAVVAGARAVGRARRLHRGGQTGRPTALLLGLPAAALGAILLAAADGGPGTGNGVVASAVAIVLGAVAVALDRFAALQRAATASRPD